MFIMKILTTTILISLLTGCATGDKDSILPQDGPTMKQVYDGHFNGEGHTAYPSHEGQEGQTEAVSPRAEKQGLSIKRQDQRDVDLSAYTRNSYNEIQNIFPRLKNKALILYVFPHLSKGERHPIPGYSTVFSFYKETEYALPGELMEGY